MVVFIYSKISNKSISGYYILTLKTDDGMNRFNISNYLITEVGDLSSSLISGNRIYNLN